MLARDLTIKIYAEPEYSAENIQIFLEDGRFFTLETLIEALNEVRGLFAKVYWKLNAADFTADEWQMVENNVQAFMKDRERLEELRRQSEANSARGILEYEDRILEQAEQIRLRRSGESTDISEEAPSLNVDDF